MQSLRRSVKRGNSIVRFNNATKQVEVLQKKRLQGSNGLSH